MDPALIREWQPGERVTVRGAAWSVAQATRFADCQELRLSPDTGERDRTILVPFDRPRRLRVAGPAHVRPRKWLHVVRALQSSVRPFGGVWHCPPGIRLLPFQLEPALAMLRHGWLRLLIADEVGLGKTIEAGLILHDLSERDVRFRALVVVPAGLRAQWTSELARHFDIAAIEADAAWLRQRARELPGDVNPWSLPGVYLTSFDFLKRPEVLRPIEDALWDLVVVDEAHAAAAGTDRRAAVNAVAVRSRRVVLLTATPGWGDRAAIRSLSAVGEVDGGPPLAVIRRTRAAVLGTRPRRAKLLPVRLTAAERRMHARLMRYASAVWEEASARGDTRARLAVVVLRKRALSSAASLHVSASRRLALLSDDPPPVLTQLALPLDDDELLDDAEPDAVLGAPGLGNAARERRMLEAVVRDAAHAARSESKVRVLRRLLRRLREPAVVFTEYRDTLARLRAALSADSRHVLTLHGGMPTPDRNDAVRQFTSTESILVATDAAAEGLNLHGRARVIVHYELPWNPARLEQRAGRVDRFGQSRAVHEIALVARHTAESHVLAPLARRSCSRTVGNASRLFELLTESRVAEAVLGGRPAAEPFGDTDPLPPFLDLSADAEAETARIGQARRWAAPRRGGLRRASGARVESIVMKRRSALPAGIVEIHELRLSAPNAGVLHSELVVLAGGPDRRGQGFGVSAVALAKAEGLRYGTGEADGARRGTAGPEGPLGGGTADQRLERVRALAQSANAALRDREQAIVRPHEAASRSLVQAGLFDRRALRHSAQRQRSARFVIEDSARRREALSDDRLSATARLRAVLRVLS